MAPRSTIIRNLPTPPSEENYDDGNIGVKDSNAVDYLSSQEKELHSDLKNVEVVFEKFFGTKPAIVDRRFNLTLSDHTYLPKVSNPKADWVVCSASVAFRAYQNSQYNTVRRFATIGTGSGTDVIAALDIFPDLTGVGMTDIHKDVVELAKQNVLSATEKADDRVRALSKDIVARAGDVLEPLRDESAYDIIYENLPNIPLKPREALTDGQTSSTYVSEHPQMQFPKFVSGALLELHYLCLVQAKTFGLLSRSGAVLSSMGGRLPVELMLRMASAAGFSARVLSLSWKIQSEPESVIGGYAYSETQGQGPFQFYPSKALAHIFSGHTPTGAALCASRIEAELCPYRLTATEALKQHRDGVEIGHTIVVLASVAES